jgi:hypothetical protein
MRRSVVLLAAVAGVVAGFMAVSDDAAACGWLRRPPVCYGPPQVYYYPPPAYYYPPPGYYCPPPGYAPVAPQPPLPRAVTIKGKTYYILPTGEKGEHDEEELIGNRTVFAKDTGIPESDVFLGKVRKIAKVTIFKGETKTFNSVSELREWLPPDKDMKDLNIGKGVNVNRVEQEKWNVTVKAYLYTFRKEDDNDYHVIIGDAPGTPGRKFLNVEVSGIPEIGTDENRNQLWNVRKAFREAFELGGEGPDRYDPLHEPVPVLITGSLFWDVEHPPPRTVGPTFASPRTAWEIHPVSRIEFLD